MTDNDGIPITTSFNNRIKIETAVRYGSCQEAILSGLSDDLSVGGLYLKTNVPLNLDETLMLSFSLRGQEQEKTVNCKASVAWTNFDMNLRKPDLPSGVGLQFVDLLREDLVAISSFINEYDKNTKMTITCAWCSADLGERRGPADTISHGICRVCFDKLNVKSESKP
jgi:Tfp pilus assembly protein PilZ